MPTLSAANGTYMRRQAARVEELDPDELSLAVEVENQSRPVRQLDMFGLRHVTPLLR